MPKNFLISSTLQIDKIQVGKASVNADAVVKKLFGNLEKNIEKQVFKGAKQGLDKLASKPVKLDVELKTKGARSAKVPGLDKKAAETAATAFAASFSNALRAGLGGIRTGHILNFDKIFNIADIKGKTKNNIRQAANVALGQINEAASRLDIGKFQNIVKILKNLTPGSRSKKELDELTTELFRFQGALDQLDAAAKTMAGGVANSLGIGKAAFLEQLKPILASIKELRKEADKGISVRYNFESQNVNLKKQQQELDKAAREQSFKTFGRIRQKSLRKDFVGVTVERETKTALSDGTKLTGRDRSTIAAKANAEFAKYIKTLEKAGLVESQINTLVLDRIRERRNETFEVAKTNSEQVSANTAAVQSLTIRSKLNRLLQEQAALAGEDANWIKLQQNYFEGLVQKQTKSASTSKQIVDFEKAALAAVQERLNVTKAETQELIKQEQTRGKDLLNKLNRKDTGRAFVQASVARSRQDTVIGGGTFGSAEEAAAVKQALSAYKILNAEIKKAKVSEEVTLRVIQRKTAEINKQVAASAQLAKEAVDVRVASSTALRLQKQFVELVQQQAKYQKLSVAEQNRLVNELLQEVANAERLPNSHRAVLSLLREQLAVRKAIVLEAKKEALASEEAIAKARAEKQARAQAALEARDARKKAISENQASHQQLLRNINELARVQAKREGLTRGQQKALEGSLIQQLAPTSATSVKDLSKVSDARIIADTERKNKLIADTNNALKALKNNERDATNSTRVLTKAVHENANAFETFGKRSRLAIGRYIAYLAPTTALFAVFGALRQGISDFLEFENVQTKLAQVLDVTSASLGRLAGNIKNVARETGQSAIDVGKGAVQLAQAGFGRNIASKSFGAGGDRGIQIGSANAINQSDDLSRAISEIAKAQLGPSFEGIEETVNGLIAVFRQFNLELSDTSRILDVTNQLSKDFSIESKDFFTAVQRGGSIFATAGGSFEEFAKLLTVLRNETRESAETLGTFFKTIGSRLFRPQEETALKGFDQNILNSNTISGRIEGIASAVSSKRQNLATQRENIVSNPQATQQEIDAAEQAYKIGLQNLKIEEIRLATQIAGTRQAGRFVALMNGLINQGDKLNESLSKAFGSIDKDVQKRINDLGVAFSQIGESISQIFQNILDGPIGKIINAVTQALSYVANFTAEAKTFSDVAAPLAIGGLAVGGAAIIPDIIKGFTEPLGAIKDLGPTIDENSDVSKALRTAIIDNTAAVRGMTAEAAAEAAAKAGLTAGTTAGAPYIPVGFEAAKKRTYRKNIFKDPRGVLSDLRGGIGDIATGARIRGGSLLKAGGRFLKSPIGLGAIGSIAGGLLSSGIQSFGTQQLQGEAGLAQFKQTGTIGSGRYATNIGSSIAAGAGTGAGIGAFLGPGGIAIGTVLGTVAGAFKGLLGSLKEETELRKQLGNILLEEASLRGVREKDVSSGTAVIAGDNNRKVKLKPGQVSASDFFGLEDGELKDFGKRADALAIRQGRLAGNKNALIASESVKRNEIDTALDVLRLKNRATRVDSEGNTIVDDQKLIQSLQEVGNAPGANFTSAAEAQKALVEAETLGGRVSTIFKATQRDIINERESQGLPKLSDKEVNETAIARLNTRFGKEGTTVVQDLLDTMGQFVEGTDKVKLSWSDINEEIANNISNMEAWASAINIGTKEVERSSSSILTTFKSSFLNAGDVKDLLEGAFTPLINGDLISSNIEAAFSAIKQNFDPEPLKAIGEQIGGFLLPGNNTIGLWKDFDKVFNQIGSNVGGFTDQLNTAADITNFFSKKLLDGTATQAPNLKTDREAFLGELSVLRQQLESTNPLDASGNVVKGFDLKNVASADQILQDFFKSGGLNLSEDQIKSVDWDKVFEAVLSGDDYGEIILQNLGLDELKGLALATSKAAIDRFNEQIKNGIELFQQQQETIKNLNAIEQERIQSIGQQSSAVSGLIEGLGIATNEGAQLGSLFKSITGLNYSRTTDFQLANSDRSFDASLSAASQQLGGAGISVPVTDVVKTITNALIPAFNAYTSAANDAKAETSNLGLFFKSLASEQNFIAIKNGFDTVFGALKDRANSLAEGLQRNLSKLQDYLGTINKVSDTLAGKKGSELQQDISLTRTVTDKILASLAASLGSKAAAETALSNNVNIGQNTGEIVKAATPILSGLQFDELTRLRETLSKFAGADPESTFAGQNVQLGNLLKAVDLAIASASGNVGLSTTGAIKDLEKVSPETSQLIAAYSQVSSDLAKLQEVYAQFNAEQLEATRENIDAFRDAAASMPTKIDIGGKVEIELNMGNLGQLQSIISAELKNNVLQQAKDAIVAAIDAAVPGAGEEANRAIGRGPMGIAR